MSLRRCVVKDQLGYFHRWMDETKILIRGSNIETMCNSTLGIVELDNGNILEVKPSDVRFIDRDTTEEIDGDFVLNIMRGNKYGRR